MVTPPAHTTPLPVADVREGQPRLRRHRIGATIVGGYLMAAAAAALAGQWLPLPSWLALHLLLLGAASNAILLWSRHFAQALLHARHAPDTAAYLRLGTLNAGMLLVLISVPNGWSALVIAGAGLVVAAALWHAASLVRMVVASTLSGKLRDCVRYYIASAVALSVGASLGAVLATSSAHTPGVHLAHVHTNLLGWVGFALLGTLFMLWPAVLRTRMDDTAPRTARQALPVVAVGLGVAVAALVVLPPDLGARVAAAGITVYLLGALLSLRPFVDAVRRKHPQGAPAWMLAAGTLWLLAALLYDAAALARGSDAAMAALGSLVPVLAVGVIGQVLVGALTFLLPVTLGAGPQGNRRLTAVLQQGWVARTVLLNAGLALLVLGPEGVVRRAAGALTLVALASAVPLLLTAVVLSRRRTTPDAPAAPSAARATVAWTEQVAIGSVLAVLAALTLVAAPATASSGSADSGAVRTVEVALTEFAVTPSRIDVAPGTQLVLQVRNEGAARHDLRFPGGRATPVLAPGAAAELDLGVVDAALEGWCTLAGHRAAGMTLVVSVDADAPAPSPSEPSDGHAHGHGDHGSGDSTPEPAAPPPAWQPYDATLAPAPGGTEHHVTLRVEETEVEVAPGKRQRMWTFGGTVPGPALRGKVGDLFVVRLVNDGTIEHSIDFHASAVSPDELMRPIPPGGELVYAFRAEHAGAWLYHCSVAPMIQHVAMGMYGAVVIDPPDLAPVDRELLLVQSEVFLAGDEELAPVARMTDADEDLVVFNGRADQYADAPIAVDSGDRVRIWVVNAGPSQASAFHVVGTQFDTVYEEGRYALRTGDPLAGGAQVLDVPPGAGGFVELVVPAPGRYPVVTHRLADAARGATGLLVAER